MGNPGRPAAMAIGIVVGIADTAGRLVRAVASERRPSSDDPEARVAEWKEAWAEGAQARWSNGGSATNPHAPDSLQANAWTAGAQWAADNPDRREPSRVRFAHQLRRRTDSGSRLRRATQAGTVGLSIVALTSWWWRRSKVRPKNDE